MIFNTENKEEAYKFIIYTDELIKKKSLIEVKDVKRTRTNDQNAARWLYLSQVAEILNERGETFTPTGLKIEVKYTKDNLYHNYWQTLRGFLFPEKTKQLTTKEFSDLVEMVLMLMAKSFEISIPFPSLESKENQK